MANKRNLLYVLPQSQRVRWVLSLGAVSMVLIGIALLFLLTVSTNNRAQYEETYSRLLVLNVVVAALLLALIVWISVRLIISLRQGKFGSQLLAKLALIFALVGFAPGLLIYVVSYQFVSRSIESWFDVKVESALNAGLNLGQASLDALSSELGNHAKNAAARLSGMSDGAASLELERVREQLSAQDVLLWSSTGQLLSSTGAGRYQINPERPTITQLKQAKTKRVSTTIEGLDESAGSDASVGAPTVVNAEQTVAKIKVIAIVENASVGMLAEPRFLQITQHLPANLTANALAVTEANREYQNRALAREGLKRMYIGTLTLSLFLAVFSAVLLAVFLGAQLAAPLLLLADGVRQVAAGDLTPKAVMQSKDELGGLTRSFAEMTQQLADARGAVESSMVQVNGARENLQTIMDNLTSGVVVMDEQGNIKSANPSAARILNLGAQPLVGSSLFAFAQATSFAKDVQRQFDAYLSEQKLHQLDHWQHAFVLHRAADQGLGDAPTSDVSDMALATSTSPYALHQTINLVARGAELPGAGADTATDAKALRLLVFDDISEIVSSQRSQAWGEVARRLAHEIKNPLTPIQLSAQRLEKKLTGKVDATDQAMLTKSVKTIVDQVDAMKRLVNEFRDYARLPAAELKPLDLNALVLDVLQLYGADETQPRQTTHGGVFVSAQLDARCPLISADAHQLRQVLHNLLQNAIDATETSATKAVLIATQWNADLQRVRLMVSDSGAGFPDHILKRAFEPYVTTKNHGTGLGLAVVKKIVQEHGARIDISNRVTNELVQGAQVSLSFAVDT